MVLISSIILGIIAVVAAVAAAIVVIMRQDYNFTNCSFRALGP